MNGLNIENTESFIDFVNNGDKIYFTDLSMDCVIFSYEGKQLRVLLVKFTTLNGWSLPGGYIRRDETLTKAANRILKERTNLDNIFLRQFHVFGDSEFRLHNDKYASSFNIPKDNWLFQRRFTIGVYALIDSSKVQIINDAYFDEYKWINIEEIPNDLLYDHNEVITVALKTIRNQIFQEPIGYELLPEKFTLPEIQTLYETILGKKLNRRNFPTKLLLQEIIVKLDEKRNIGQHRSPYLYKFHKDNYQNALNEKIVITL
jgi:ADP-ribose pyrophosphatase YjhB (NUDIX family)